jgi:hypothetical protein
VILNRPFVIHYMDDWVAKLERQKGAAVSDVYRALMRLLFARAAKVMAISRKMADYLHRDFDVPQARLGVAHNFIQDSPVLAATSKDGAKVLRYFGGMEPDMALASILAVAGAVEAMNQGNGPQVRFEIYTAEHYIAKSADAFAGFRHTALKPQTEDYAAYLGLLRGSDINLLCYNFDETSETYLRYSMANKLPEIIGAERPFIAIGSPEIGTITYLRDEAYPFVLDRDDKDALSAMIRSVLFDPASASEAYFESLTRLKEEFSEARNRHGFQVALRQAAAGPKAPFSAGDLDEIERLSDVLHAHLAEQQGRYGGLDVLKVLLRLPPETKAMLGDLVRTHGLDWQFKSKGAQIKRILNAGLPAAELPAGDIALLLAYLIVSLRHERFEDINARIVSLLVSAREPAVT